MPEIFAKSVDPDQITHVPFHLGSALFDSQSSNFKDNFFPIDSCQNLSLGTAFSQAVTPINLCNCAGWSALLCTVWVAKHPSFLLMDDSVPAKDMWMCRLV